MEMYGLDMVKDIQRLDSDLFTINHLSNDIFKVKHINTSRNKVTDWTNAGASKHIGSEKLSSSKKPVHLYYLVDPRLNRVINSSLTITDFFKQRWIECESCGADILIDKEMAEKRKLEMACWNCDYPLLI